jgi:hypothetical protein
VTEGTAPGWVKQADDDPEDGLTRSELSELTELAGQSDPESWLPVVPEEPSPSA